MRYKVIKYCWRREDIAIASKYLMVLLGSIKQVYTCHKEWLNLKLLGWF